MVVCNIERNVTGVAHGQLEAGSIFIIEAQWRVVAVKHFRGNPCIDWVRDFPIPVNVLNEVSLGETLTTSAISRTG